MIFRLTSSAMPSEVSASFECEACAAHFHRVARAVDPAINPVALWRSENNEAPKNIKVRNS